MWGGTAALQAREAWRWNDVIAGTFRNVGTAFSLDMIRTLSVLSFALFIAGVALSASAQDGGPSRYWFEVETLNPGLPEPPRTLDRETPQATLEDFLYLTSGREYGPAAHLLDLREVPEAEQAGRGPELARKLKVILERRVWIGWDVVTDRPDGLSTDGGKDAPMAGEPRRSIRLALIELDNRSVPVRLNRIKPGSGEPVWLFSRQTVENIDALYRIHGPTALERAMPSALRQDLFLGLQYWELVALPVMLLATFLAGLLVYRVLGWLAERDAGRLSAVAGAVRLPIALGVGGILGWATLEHVVSFNGAVMLFLNPLIWGFLVLAGAILLVRVIDALLELAIARNTKDIQAAEAEEERDFYTNVSGARRLITVIVLLFGVGLVLSQTNFLQNVGFAALGGASILTLILAFAGRAALSNIMASLQIAFAKPVRIGDTLMFQGEWCVVERIRFTYVELRVWDGRLLIVPVNEFVSEVFENLTKSGAELTRTVFLTLDHRADLEALRGAMASFLDGDDRVTDPAEAKLVAYAHDRDGLRVRAQVPTVDPSTGWTLALELREHLLAEARDLEAERGEPFLPVERELKVGSRRDGLANVEWDTARAS